jgi:hypothetical protein
MHELLQALGTDDVTLEVAVQLLAAKVKRNTAKAERMAKMEGATLAAGQATQAVAGKKLGSKKSAGGTAKKMNRGKGGDASTAAPSSASAALAQAVTRGHASGKTTFTERAARTATKALNDSSEPASIASSGRGDGKSDSEGKGKKASKTITKAAKPTTTAAMKSSKSSKKLPAKRHKMAESKRPPSAYLRFRSLHWDAVKQHHSHLSGREVSSAAGPLPPQLLLHNVPPQSADCRKGIPHQMQENVS